MSSDFSPLDDDSPSIPCASCERSEVLPESIAGQGTNFACFFLTSVVCLLCVQAIDPPEHIFRDPAECRFSSVSVQAKVRASLAFASGRSPRYDPPW